MTDNNRSQFSKYLRNGCSIPFIVAGSVVTYSTPVANSVGYKNPGLHISQDWKHIHVRKIPGQKKPGQKKPGQKKSGRKKHGRKYLVIMF